MGDATAKQRHALKGQKRLAQGIALGILRLCHIILAFL